MSHNLNKNIITEPTYFMNFSTTSTSLCEGNFHVIVIGATTKYTVNCNEATIPLPYLFMCSCKGIISAQSFIRGYKVTLMSGLRF